ncbi:MAG TPA: hypothetical protein VKQ72_21470 [Aggregatilineales bacterium]|nr:hypothetical protein [Aggregatilineales bacterium]
MLTRSQVAPLRLIAARLGLPELEQIALQAGVTETFRLTIKYHDGHHPDQVATAVKHQSRATPSLSVLYRRVNGDALTLEHALDLPRFRSLIATLKKIGFDRLDDDKTIDWVRSDVWLVERAASAFHHDVIIAPATATGIYADTVALVTASLREAVRAIAS